ncbi:MAG: hypothetical protein ACLS95_03875 [Clostridia bacterium]
MRKGRIIFWGIYAILLVMITLICNNKEVIKAFFEEKEKPEEILQVYCIESEKESFKERMEKIQSATVNFVEDKDQAQIVITDVISSEEETKYQVIAYTPLVIGISTDSKIKKEYQKLGYLSKEDDTIFYFDKLIEDVLEGEFTQNIYCPKEDCIKGEIFYDFLLITVNHGKYPQKEELEVCEEKVNAFLSSSSVYQVNVEKWLREKKTLDGQICISYETDLLPFISTINYNVQMQYPETTLLYKLYYSQINNQFDFLHEHNTLGNSYYQDLYRVRNYRCDGKSYLKYQRNFSYTEIPLK